MSNTITNNNTPALTADQLWNLIDLAFPIKTKGFRYTDNDGLFFNPSRGDQRYTPELREWSVAELNRLRAIVEAFGYGVRIGTRETRWPIVNPTAK